MAKRKRKPLEDDNKYMYPRFPTRGFRVKWFTFKENDGLKGVAIHWFGLGRGVLSSGFYPFKSERAFWQNSRFAPMVDQSSTQQ
jgi:hypothetical protein